MLDYSPGSHEENMVDLSSLVDRTVLQIVPEMRLEQVHQILGAHHGS